jgi:integrase
MKSSNVLPDLKMSADHAAFVFFTKDTFSMCISNLKVGFWNGIGTSSQKGGSARSSTPSVQSKWVLAAHAAPAADVPRWPPSPNQGHGFRTSFRSWAADCTDYPREIAEKALGHVVPGNEGAYQRGELLAKRRKLMDDCPSIR